MRSTALATLGLGALCACGADKPIEGTPDAPTGETTLPPPARGFQIKSPTVDIDPGKEVTYCYYFRTPNKTDLAIQKWASHMTPGSHHMILFLTASDQQPPGTLLTSGCGFSGGGVVGSAWTYSAQTPDAESPLPRDDGHGVPVGQPVKADQSGFLQMHYLNATDAVIHAHVELNAYAYDEGVQITPAGPFVTYNTSIDLDPGSMVDPSTGMVNGTCDVRNRDGTIPKFYVMTTHSHKQSVHTFVKDGDKVVFDSRNWDHPGAVTWDGAPFYSFTSGQLTYQCEYVNPNNYRIQTGDSAAINEMCMAVGYYFPAAGGKGHLCLTSGLTSAIIY